MIQYELRSFPGERPVNEDCVLADQEGEQYCFVLCDGLGGHGKGDLASRLTAKKVIEEFHRQPSCEHMGLWIQKAQEELLRQQKSMKAEEEMKTTLVVLWVGNRQIRWGHIGDSRLYRFQRGIFGTKIFRTFDHSVPQMLVAAGTIKEKEIRHHEDRNRLLRVMGIEWDSPRYELGSIKPARKGQAFLLCSDGWWEWIEEEGMKKSLQEASCVGDWMESMEKEVRNHGKGSEMDNFSAIGVWI